MSMQTVVTANGVVVAGAEARLLATLKRDGVAFTDEDLAGKTVRCTVRAVIAPNTIVHAGLEGIECEVPDTPEGTENVWCVLTAELTAHLATPDNPQQTRDYQAQFWIEAEDYVAPLMRFPVRRPGAVLNPS